jgi:hypothetical protein
MCNKFIDINRYHNNKNEVMVLVLKFQIIIIIINTHALLGSMQQIVTLNKSLRKLKISIRLIYFVKW